MTAMPPSPPKIPEPVLFAPTELVPDVSEICVQDDTPVESFFHGHQRQLLVEPLESSWAGPGDGRPFLVAANCGVFFSPGEPAIVPDAMLSLDVKFDRRGQVPEQNSYFVWIAGKPPDVVVEVISRTPGGEDTDKLRQYAKIGVSYYAIFDPFGFLSDEEFRIFRRDGRRFRRVSVGWMEDAGIGLTVWEGPYGDDHGRWLRWCDANGQVIPTGAERAVIEAQRAESEKQRAESEKQRAESEKQRANAVEQKLHQMEEKMARYTERLLNAGLSTNGG